MIVVYHRKRRDRIYITSSKESEFDATTRLRKFFEQSDMDEGKCDAIFKVISTWDNTLDQTVTDNSSQKKTVDFFFQIL